MRHSTVVLLAAAALCCAAPALAQETSPEGTVRVGGAFLSGDKDSAKLQRYEVMPENKATIDVDFDWNLGRGLYIAGATKNALFDDERIGLEFGRRAGFKAGLFYTRSPNWISNTARSYFTDIGGDVFTIPAAIHSQMPAAANLSGFASYAVPVDLRVVRRTTGAYTSVPFGEGFTFTAKYQDEQRSGHMPQTWGSGFSSVVELPVAVDYSTRNADFSLEYADKDLFLRTTAFVSSFRNGYDRIVWENPNQYLTPTASAPTVLQTATAPDNRAFNVDVSASYNLPARHRITALVGIGQMRQDQALLPYTSNSAIALSNPAALPVGNADGKIDTTLYTLKLTGDPIPLLGYSLSYRYYDMDNRSPEIDLTPVQGDAGSAGADTTDPIGWKKVTWKAELHVNAAAWLRVGIGYDHDKWDHQGRAVASNTQKTVRGFADVQFAQWVGLHASYSDVKFTADCIEEDCAIEDEAAGATHFDIAERKTKRYDAVLTVTPLDGLSIGLTAAQDKSDYEDSVFGLTYRKTHSYGLDVSYAFGETFSVYGGYVKDKMDWDQASRYRAVSPPAQVDNPLNNWFAQTRDDNKTWSLGADWKAIKDKLSFSADYTKSDGSSAQQCIPVYGTVPANELYQGNCIFPAPPAGTFGTPQTWPEVDAKFTWLKVKGYYTFSKALSAGLEFWKYKFEGVDWASDMTQIYMGGYDPSAAKFVFMGVKNPDYDAKIFRAYLDYRF